MVRAEGTYHPVIVAHADWSTSPGKRWLARAGWDGSAYTAEAPEPVDESAGLLARLHAQAGMEGSVFAGFDFPFGLPRRYAERAGIDDYMAWLPEAGRGEWADFFNVAESPAEVSLRRPFYPRKPGSARRSHLLDGLGLAAMSDLLRACDRPHLGRRAACPLFWTLGGQQVGKAAISGWQAILLHSPAAGEGRPTPEPVVWPFAGQLTDLLRPGQVVVCETYPAEYYGPLGISFAPRRRGGKSGKRVQSDRAANAAALADWANKIGVIFSPALQQAIATGFGPAPDGEDRFDALIGLFGMLSVTIGLWPPGEPDDPAVRRVEGWILGQNSPSPAAIRP